MLEGHPSRVIYHHTAVDFIVVKKCPLHAVKIKNKILVYLVIYDSG